MSSVNIYSSPLCSCIVCREPKSSKSIHTHFLSKHTDAETKARVTGTGNRKKPDQTKQKQQTEQRRIKYIESPLYCSYCKVQLPYETRNAKYCSHTCAATDSNSKKDFSKIKTGPPKGTSPSNKFGLHTKVYQCVICQKWFIGTRKVCDNKQCRHDNLVGKTGGYRPNSTRNTRVVYEGTKFDSGAEVAFVQLLNRNNIKWIKNTTVFFEYLPKKKYYPDFYLEEFDLWVEVKGKYYYREDDPLRWASVLNHEVIWANDIKLPTKMAPTKGLEPS